MSHNLPLWRDVSFQRIFAPVVNMCLTLSTNTELRMFLKAHITVWQMNGYKVWNYRSFIYTFFSLCVFLCFSFMKKYECIQYSYAELTKGSYQVIMSCSPCFGTQGRKINTHQLKRCFHYNCFIKYMHWCEPAFYFEKKNKNKSDYWNLVFLNILLAMLKSWYATPTLVLPISHCTTTLLSCSFQWICIYCF